VGDVAAPVVVGVETGVDVGRVAEPLAGIGVEARGAVGLDAGGVADPIAGVGGEARGAAQVRHR
jgi:hypothetical protein